MLFTYSEILRRLLFASVMGAAIGVERDLRRRSAGVRTSLFVCLATALFTILSAELAHAWGDTSGTRIASNIVQGIGFLGAGAILKEGGGLFGMTTAATIFAEAAIGMAAGGGYYAVAGTAAAVVLIALVFVGWLETQLNVRGRLMVFRFTTSHADNVATEIQNMLMAMKLHAGKLKVSANGPNSIVEFEADVNHSEQVAIVEQLNRQGVVTEVLPIRELQD